MWTGLIWTQSMESLFSFLLKTCCKFSILDGASSGGKSHGSGAARTLCAIHYQQGDRYWKKWIMKVVPLMWSLALFLLDCKSCVKLAMFVWLIQVNALDFIVLGSRLIKWEMKHQWYKILFLDWMQQAIFMRENIGMFVEAFYIWRAGIIILLKHRTRI